MTSDNANAKEEAAPVGDAATNDASYDPFSSAGGSLPLIVKMPDGERHQVDVPANSSVRDLKHQIANMTSTLAPTTEPESQNLQWDLDFAGSILNDNHSLEHYHIPDAYDHANGLLKTISDSGYGDPDKKVEALDKAYAVVQGISRGERDMERLINAVFEEAGDNVLDSPSTQPSITAMRRSRRSRIPSLNFNQLAPIADSIPVKGAKPAGLPSAPPTPSQLIRRLSNFRPDLYDPNVVAKATAPFLPRASAPGAPSAANAVGSTSADPPLPAEPSAPAPTILPVNVHVAQPPESGPSHIVPASSAQPSSVPVPSTSATNAQGQGSGELKRGNTWFTEVISSFGNSAMNVDESGESDGAQDVDGDSEGDEEGDGQTRTAGANSTGSDDVSKQNGKVGSTSAVASNDVKREFLVSEDGTAEGSNGLNRNSGVDQESLSRGDDGDEDQIAKGGASSSKTSDTPSSPSHSIASGAKSVRSHGQVIGLEPDIPLTAPPETVHVKVPKKRGRKRKNPHLSEEERKAQRQAQNRESAKLSRIRRKNMTMEYEKRVNTLEGENENLRDTVAALTDRLEMLQNLLTISVQKRPMPSGAMNQLRVASVQQAAVAAAAGRGQLGGMDAEQSLNVSGLGVNAASFNAHNAVGLMPGVGMQQSQSVSQAGARSIPPASGPLPNLDFNHLP